MILLNDFKRQWADTSGDVLRAVTSVGESGWYILGQRVRDFESALAARWGAKYAVGVASGLDAIELSLRALGCGPGDLVLTSPISAFATTLAIVKAGATPVFADCDPYGLVDLAECRRLLAAHPDIRYFVPVHLYGHSLDLEQLRLLRDQFDLKIVEDCAQSIGARHGGRHAGTVGDFAATSFYPTKNLGAMGDGGAVLSDSAAGAEKVRQLRDYGQTGKYRHDLIGYNSRLDELHAAILHAAFLPRLENWTRRRQAIAACYQERIRAGAVHVPGSPPGSQSCWHLFPVAVDAARKAAAMSHFNSKGITVGEHYPRALAEQNALQGHLAPFGSDCPRSRAFCRAELSLPIHPYLSDQEADAVVAACNSWM